MFSNFTSIFLLCQCFKSLIYKNTSTVSLKRRYKQNYLEINFLALFFILIELSRCTENYVAGRVDGCFKRILNNANNKSNAYHLHCNILTYAKQ